ncbi:hypothetical protein FRX31_010555, partial [Thalictrum thalictroides]
MGVSQKCLSLLLLLSIALQLSGLTFGDDKVDVARYGGGGRRYDDDDCRYSRRGCGRGGYNNGR